MRAFIRRLSQMLEGATPSTEPAPSFLLEMTQALAGVVSREELSSLLIGRVAEKLSIREAALLLPGNERSLMLVESSGWPESVGPPPSLPRRGSLAGRLLQACRPIPQVELLSSVVGELTEAETWWLGRSEADLWVPLVRRGVYGRYIMGKLQGVLLLGPGDLEAPLIGAKERRILHSVSLSAAVAAENVELVETVRAKAAEANQLYVKVLSSREEERKRIARELHDSVIQDLIDLLYRLNGPGFDDSSDASVFRTRLRDIIDRTRRLCAELRPPALDDLDLPLAIRGYVEDVRDGFGLDVRFLQSRKGRASSESVSEESRVCLFRILQEGLMNVQRHAGAKKVEVELHVEEEEVTLAIRDDGRGFDCPVRLSSLVREGRFGLAGAQERVGLLGGILEVESRPGRGTRISARLPVTQAKREPATESC